MRAVFCLIISLFTLGCGVGYLVAGYEILIGWVQVALGTLCLALVLAWKFGKKRVSGKEDAASA